MQAIKKAGEHTARNLLECRRAMMQGIRQSGREVNIDGGGITAGHMINGLVMKGTWRSRKSELGYWANILAMHLKGARSAELGRRLNAAENKAVEKKVVEDIITMLKKRAKML
ncbi:MAG: hypothetical protein HYW05_03765 [Candidatus Diapherotrites archaeon]|nr:hypothetical protein [Candidatus Diapherotrites archaeon]